MLPEMDDDDRPFAPGGFPAGPSGLSGRDDAASRLAAESLDRYSRDELDQRIALLVAEIERVTAHRAAGDAHRLAAEQLFARKP